MSKKIQIKNLIKIFGPAPRRRALSMLKDGVGKDEILEETGHIVGVNQVSFDVEQGEIFVVMGLSGSGKSTLIRCINRLYEPTDGEVLLDDEDVAKVDRNRLEEIRRTKMAMVFQHFGLFPHKSVVYNAAYGLKVQGMDEASRREKAIEALELVGLKEWADHLPSELSGGMQQRVGLARALATDADVLLMDEAFSALDPLIRRQMQDELIELQERLKKTIVFITHDLNEALRVGNHVAVMRDGEVVQIGTPTEIITEPANEYVARFMADVDQARVLSAEFVMKPALKVQNNTTAKAALAAMDKAGADAIYVVNQRGEVDGLLERSALATMSQNGADRIQRALQANFPVTARFTPLNELYRLCKDGVPIAVMNDAGRLQGVVHPLDVLAALAVAEEVAVE
ncbi:MAG: glycine betaine/L-proline ABC transporter ATP-binding protein [Litorilinea sp.]